MKWISHRGESQDAPENTLAAFKLAVQRDTDGFETDIHLTKDGKLVCIHDSQTGRVADKDLNIENSTLEELRRINYNTKFDSCPAQKIPEFYELLELLSPGKTFLIEIKQSDEKVLEKMASELERLSIPHKQIVVICFMKEIVAASKKYMPDIKTLWLTSFEKKEGKTVPSVAESIVCMKDMKADGIDACCQIDNFDEKYVQTLKKEGFFVSVWTANDPKTAKYYISSGVDFITSNCAAALKKDC